MPDVLLATSAERPDLWEDEFFLVDALKARGLTVAPAVWNDPAVDWGGARLVMLRSVFDYVQARDEFLAWAETIRAHTQLHNPARLIRWNSHKRYLRELEATGLPIVPTEWIEAGATVNLPELLDANGWHDAVVKPTVGNGSRGAQRVGRDTASAFTAERDTMIQPYLTATENPGEHALIHIGGTFTHAISKDQMLAGREFSLDRTPRIDPDPRELELAAKLLGRIPEQPLLYARVDTIVDGDVVRLMELEVIEPVLFFTKAPEAATKLAQEIESRLES
jgi:glutathione synthase/RimK-type ligase-like ATP-grasp enzyme